MPPRPPVLLHNTKATYGFQRFTRPNETIMCAVHTGTVVSGQGWWGRGRGGSLKLSGLKAPDKAEEVLQDVTEFRPEAPRAGCRISCCRIIITPRLWWHRPHLWHQPASKSSNLITLQLVKGKMRQLWLCLFWVKLLYAAVSVHGAVNVMASGYFMNHSFASCPVCRL